MAQKWVGVFLVVLAFSCGAPKEEILTVFYSASLNGNIEDCGCTSNPRYGLAKRSAYLKAMEKPEAALLVDGGNLFSGQRNDFPEEEILEVYKELGYDAIAAGFRELLMGPAKLMKYAGKYPLISNNLMVPAGQGRMTVFSMAPRIFNKGSFKIILFSIIGDEMIEQAGRWGITDYKNLDTREAMTTVEAFLKDKSVDLSVMLYHGSRQSMENFLAEYGGIDLVILAGEMKLLDAEKVHGAVVVSPGEEGNRLGRVEFIRKADNVVFSKNSFKHFDQEEDPEDPLVVERAKNYKEKLKSGLETYEH